MNNTMQQAARQEKLEAALSGTTVPNSIEDMGLVMDRHTKQIINFRRMFSESEVCKHFGITKGQLKKAIKRKEFPIATVLRPGNKPFWADTIIARTHRQDDPDL